MPRPRRPTHKITAESMVSWSCSCGGRWYNEQLKGKTDEDLWAEVQISFADHQDNMEMGGF